VPDGDPAALATLRGGQTVGCFQIESPAVRAVLKKLPVGGINDLAAARAIVRPGPASGEAKATFMRRAHGEEAATPPHLRLAKLLRSNHGMMVYGEDLMAAIAGLTGWPLSNADDMRASLLRTDRPHGG
jgi:DNA polymerase III alpha subunit